MSTNNPRLFTLLMEVTIEIPKLKAMMTKSLLKQTCELQKPPQISVTCIVSELLSCKSYANTI